MSLSVCSSAGHAELTRSYGGYFCYIAVPCQYVCYEDAYPTYLNNRHTYTERSSEALFARLDEKNVPYIDLREIYESAGTLWGYSSTIDNHYNIHGAFEAYRILIETINLDTSLNLTVPSNEDCTLSQIENPYLGSRIRKLCGLWESDEHLWKMTPNEPLPYIRSIKGEPADGEVYALPNNDWQEVLYTTYMGGDLSEARIDTGREEMPDILIYGDSRRTDPDVSAGSSGMCTGLPAASAGDRQWEIIWYRKREPPMMYTVYIIGDFYSPSHSSYRSALYANSSSRVSHSGSTV